MNRRIGLLASVFLVGASGNLGAAVNPDAVDNFTGKPRLLVLTDIGNEPDDQMSLVRLLLYSNEIDLEGLVATTSTWQKDKVRPDTLHEVIAAYAEVRENLLKHAADWPTAAHLDALVTQGPAAYGMAALGDRPLTTGAASLIAAADRADPRPLWIALWGGANTLAEALIQVRATRDANALGDVLARLRVYSISDQDDGGPWIRREFPGLFYIVKPSPPNAGEYGYATWTGISGDVYYRNGAGADGSTVTNEWLDTHIRAKGPLGKHYPKFAFIMEGDTPSFLGLTGNGLESFRNPSWGGWGGRYQFLQPYGETHAIWTQGGDLFPRVTSQDTVIGADNKPHVSDQATIWRWREAFQNEFSARMDWTFKTYATANHPPVAVVAGATGTAPIYLDAEAGQSVLLDASGSTDPDRNALSFRWFHYPEAGFTPGQKLADVKITNDRAARATATVTAGCRPVWIPSPDSCPASIAHVILAVTDTGTPRLTSYRRVILRVHPGGAATDK
ncbi:MAG: nucleoside hydrolase-like domain-containing protein [Pseudomonadota bacterium]